MVTRTYNFFLLFPRSYGDPAPFVKIVILFFKSIRAIVIFRQLAAVEPESFAGVRPERRRLEYNSGWRQEGCRLVAIIGKR
jgi:hypothetical protein